MRGIALIIGFLGGTGREGTGLALRFGMADKHVMIGSRKLEKARQIAGELETIAPDMNVSGDLNEHVAALHEHSGGAMVSIGGGSHNTVGGCTLKNSAAAAVEVLKDHNY